MKETFFLQSSNNDEREQEEEEGCFCMIDRHTRTTRSSFHLQRVCKVKKTMAQERKRDKKKEEEEKYNT